MQLGYWAPSILRETIRFDIPALNWSDTTTEYAVHFLIQSRDEAHQLVQ